MFGFEFNIDMMTQLEGTLLLCVYNLNHKIKIHGLDITLTSVVCFRKAIFLSFSIFRIFCILRHFPISADGLLKSVHMNMCNSWKIAECHFIKFNTVNSE
jgi:hypothetical protein